MSKKKNERDLPVYMTPSEAGRVLGLTAAGVKLHDATLRPIVTVSGRRMYSAESIHAFKEQRERARRERAQ